MDEVEELDVWEEDEEVDELEEIGAEEPHSSLHRGHVCKSESGNDAIWTQISTSFKTQRFGPGCLGLMVNDSVLYTIPGCLPVSLFEPNFSQIVVDSADGATDANLVFT